MSCCIVVTNNCYEVFTRTHLYKYHKVSLSTLAIIVKQHYYRDTPSTVRMPTVQVLILIVDKPYNSDTVGLSLDANAIEDQSTTDRPTVEILNAWTLDYFYKGEGKEKFEGGYRWRWCDSASCKIQANTNELKAEDGLVFDLASYDVQRPFMQRPSIHILDWIDSSNIGNVEAKDCLRQRIDGTISSFDKDFEAFNNDPVNNDLEQGRFRLELLGAKDFDETTSSRFAMVRKSQSLGATGTASVSSWTQRYWWEIKEIQVDRSVGSSKLKSCYPPVLLKELGMAERPDANDDDLEGQADDEI